MWTLLFDIDGTLIRTRGAGLSAIGRAMNEMFGITQLPDVAVHGRTDFGIVNELLMSCGIEPDGRIEELFQRYWGHLPHTLQENKSGAILPGVEDLLEHLHADDRFELGLLTGNARVPAGIKMRHFKLDRYFRFGGYGDVHADRNQVARGAFEAAQQELGERFVPEKVWVIGDTVADIDCARAINSRVVAVETGGSESHLLASAMPDIQIESLLNYRSLIEQIVQLCESAYETKKRAQG